MESEHWLPVKGFEGRYEVSDLGRVRSLPRRATTWFGTRAVSGGLLKLKTDKNGYISAYLSDGDRGYSYALVHRLVLEAFCGPCPAEQEARHGDGVRSNNRRDNLSWSTHLDNMRDQYDHGTRVAGESHPRAVVTKAMADMIRASKKSGAELARELGVGTSTVSRIRRGDHYAVAS